MSLVHELRAIAAEIRAMKPAERPKAKEVPKFDPKVFSLGKKLKAALEKQVPADEPIDPAGLDIDDLRKAFLPDMEVLALGPPADDGKPKAPNVHTALNNAIISLRMFGNRPDMEATPQAA